MNRSFKFAFLFASLSISSFSSFAQDDIYFSSKDAEEEVKEELPAYSEEKLSRHANDTDTLIAYDESDYEYSRRLNRFHDADLPIYSSEQEDSDVNITNIYVTGSPYYSYYRPGWSWGWDWSYGYYGWYDPWWDGYYYHHSHYWGPGWNYYGYYSPYHYGYGHHHHYYGGHYHSGHHYYGKPDRGTYYNRRAYSRNNMIGTRGPVRQARSSAIDGRGTHRTTSRTSSSGVRSSSPSRSYNSGSRNYSGGRSSATPSRQYNSSSSRGSSSRSSSSYNSSSSTHSSSSSSTRSSSSYSGSSSRSSSSSYSGGSRSSSSSSYSGGSRGSSSSSSHSGSRGGRR